MAPMQQPKIKSDIPKRDKDKPPIYEEMEKAGPGMALTKPAPVKNTSRCMAITF